MSNPQHHSSSIPTRDGLPRHPGRPEVRRPTSTWLFLQTRAEVALDLLQRDPARGYLGAELAKGMVQAESTSWNLRERYG